MNTTKLTKHLHENFPVISVHFKDTDRPSWYISFKPEATEEQRRLANEALLNFDISDDVAELRAARYEAECGPLLMAVLAYTVELEDLEPGTPEYRTRLEKKHAAKLAYQAAKAKIKDEMPG